MAGPNVPTDGETVGQEGHNVSQDGITLAALQSVIELVTSEVTSEARDDAQAQGAAHTPMLTDICAPAPEDAFSSAAFEGGPTISSSLCRVNTLSSSSANGKHYAVRAVGTFGPATLC